MTNRFQQGRLDALERADLRASSIRRSREAFDRARNAVRPMVPARYVDITAGTLLYMRFCDPGKKVGRARLVSFTAESYHLDPAVFEVSQ